MPENAKNRNVKQLTTVKKMAAMTKARHRSKNSEVQPPKHRSLRKGLVHEFQKTAGQDHRKGFGPGRTEPQEQLQSSDKKTQATKETSEPSRDTDQKESVIAAEPMKGICFHGTIVSPQWGSIAIPFKKMNPAWQKTNRCQDAQATTGRARLRACF